MPSLLSLCHEILHDILTNVEPADLGKLAQSCQTFNSYIKGNKLLWKDVYLKHYDNPQGELRRDSMIESSTSRSRGNKVEPDWEGELKTLVSVQKVLCCHDEEVKRNSIEPVVTTALSLLETSNPNTDDSLNVKFLSQQLLNPQNSDIFLFSSSLYDQCGSPSQYAAPIPESRQLSAKLHSHYGTALEAKGRTRNSPQQAHPFARSRVYDLRTYNDFNQWGPFTDDGTMTTDWEKVESILIVLGHNLDMLSRRCTGRGFGKVWSDPFGGAVPYSYTPIPRGCPALEKANGTTSGGDSSSAEDSWGVQFIGQPNPALEAQDPYGVTGTWRRVVCFLDYNDLYHFNFASHVLPHESRPPISTQEAIRLITMKLRVTKIVPPSEDDGQALPVVHFTGTSRSMHSSWDPNANSRLRGSVRLTPSGDIRWTTLSVFHGEARWRSESIQVGGLRSGRGVVGTWFDKDFDPNGPAGPTAFWKLSDSLGREADGVDENGLAELPALFA
ncbi:hypothetical protein EJ08DRAFT_737587 [Tothia fuscella]|uniref:F-box domain-containing protein n=1 Tax=Tothia fuscella TaxID=1048955 RepID=A0A9P4NJ77_9PEZI|nr:hypothetical protein EJ08DRAFT_737587 [Tothia fuscella]